MNWNEYKALAIRTESIPANSFDKVPYNIAAFEPGDMLSANKNATRLLHATMGICTELAELEDGQGAVNFVEEVGDVLWYLAIADDVIGWYKYSRISDTKTPLYWIGELNDAMKRHLFYGAELNIDKMITACVAIYRELVVALADREFLIEMAMEANITKLEKRFPNKYFDAGSAITRNVEHELSHIAPIAETDEELVELVKARQGEGTITVDIDKLIEEAQAPLTVKEFNAVLARCLTDYQYTQAMKGLAFIIGTNLRNEGAMLEARAYDSMYRDCVSLAVASADASLYSMWKRLGYPFQSEADVRGKLEVWK